MSDTEIQTLDGIMRGKPLAESLPLKKRYEKELVSISKQMTSQTRREITKLFKNMNAFDGTAMDATITSQSRILINAIRKKFDEFFNFKAKALSQKMVNNANKTSAAIVELSIKDLSEGLTLDLKSITPATREIMKASINNNVALIKSIHSQYFTAIEGIVYRSITEGKGMGYLVKELTKREGITIRRAKLIALDQTKKVYAALNAERSQSVGIQEFEWLHSGRGKEPRHEHVAMNGNIYRYDDPPVIDSKTGERGLPAQLINCGCIARPVLRFKKDAK